MLIYVNQLTISLSSSAYIHNIKQNIT